LNPAHHLNKRWRAGIFLYRKYYHMITFPHNADFLSVLGFPATPREIFSLRTILVFFSFAAIIFLEPPLFRLFFLILICFEWRRENQFATLFLPFRASSWIVSLETISYTPASRRLSFRSNS